VLIRDYYPLTLLAMKIENLRDLFTVKIMTLYDIETQLMKALPKMAKASVNHDLKAGFMEHVDETFVHISRLEDIFSMLGVKPKKIKVEAIRGLVADADWIIKEKPSADLLDAVLIASARYVEHYEIAGYMTAIEWAELLDMNSASELLRSTLEEESETDAKLIDIAMSSVNKRALKSTEQAVEDDED
jgi:ferritin-like metal-binding protein YciE